MTSHPNRAALPVLDDDTRDAMVIGFAATEPKALAIALAEANLRAVEAGGES